MYSNELICDILIYIDKNINDKISVNDLKEKFYYDRYYIMKLFKKEMGITIVDYINSIRVYNSLKLLKEYDSKMLNIALKIGFNSLEYFSETFKKIVGLPPKKVLLYLKNSKKLSQEDIEIIREAYVNLYDLIEKKERYLRNKKSRELPVKKLSIFK